MELDTIWVNKRGSEARERRETEPSRPLRMNDVSFLREPEEAFDMLGRAPDRQDQDSSKKTRMHIHLEDH